MATFVRTQTIDHTIGQDGRLTLKVTSGDVALHGGSGDEVRVRANYEIRASSEDEANRVFAEAQLQVDRGDGYLIVQEPDDHTSLGALVGRIFSGRGHVEMTVNVDMPAGAEVHLAGVSADVNVDGLQGDQRYATVSGDLTLARSGGSVRVNSVSGDVTVRAGQPVSVRAETVSGDLTVVAPVIRGMRANAVSGDVEIEGQLALGEEYRVDTVSGDVMIGLLGGASFEVRGISSDVVSDLDHRIEGPQDRRRVVVGAGGPNFLFNSMSGDLSIRRPRRLDRMVPVPEAPPAPPPPPAAPPPSAEDQLAILQALERGEIDVEEATRRLSGSGNE